MTRIGEFITACLAAFGIFLLAYVVSEGNESFVHGIVEGKKTEGWLFVESSHVRNTAISGHSGWGAPYDLGISKTYYYSLNGAYYHCANYDVNGSTFSGPSESVKAYRGMGEHITVYYNPDDPSDAVLKKGISFSRQTVVYMRYACIGLAMAVFGIVGFVLARQRRLTKTQEKPEP